MEDLENDRIVQAEQLKKDFLAVLADLEDIKEALTEYMNALVLSMKTSIPYTTAFEKLFVFPEKKPAAVGSAK
jgi:hypothetical protein